MENQREPMVAVVNAFYEACGLPDRCRAESHIALDERVVAAWDGVGGLREGYREALAEAGLVLE
ncbi:hypothetical protein D3C78_1887660 [compost metagenome]